MAATRSNLPRKMLHFYAWAAEMASHNFTLKLDDDCYANVRLRRGALVSHARARDGRLCVSVGSQIEAILAAIQAQGLREKRRIWWSRFRVNWAVEDAGKWKEAEYRAVVYPPFACGGGNVLSGDMVQWLARNRDDLHAYQGEDASMGIWLAAVAPTLIDDDRFHVTGGCRDDMLTAPDLDVATICRLHDSWLECRKPCGCH